MLALKCVSIGTQKRNGHSAYTFYFLHILLRYRFDFFCCCKIIEETNSLLKKFQFFMMMNIFSEIKLIKIKNSVCSSSKINFYGKAET